VWGVTTITGWAHVTLSVRDHDRSLRWYQEVLGFHPTATEAGPRWTRTLCVHRESGAILVLHQHIPGGDAEFDERRPGLDHLALGVADANALAAWQERLAALGVTSSPITPTGRGGLAISFRDPDNIALELFCLTTAPNDAP
jgi:glyoxylase I family protein